MRSDRDKRTDTEREIDDFLSKFENPADELTADIDSYLDEKNIVDTAELQTFKWKKVESSQPDAAQVKDNYSSKAEPGVVAADPASDSVTSDVKKENVTTEKQKSSSKEEKVSNQAKAQSKEKPAEKNADSSVPSDVATAASDATSKPTPSKKTSTSGKKKKKKKRKKKKTKKSSSSKSEKNGLFRKLFFKKDTNGKYRFSFLKLFRDIVCLGLVCVLAGLIYFASLIIEAPKYDYKDIYSAVDTSSIVYNDEGKQIDNIFYTENRKVVKYEDMPEDLINSFVAIEDKTFWKHHGFNWTRMVGAVLSSLTGSGRISGTSTITQQLARNVYLADTKSVRSIKRKLLEMYYANRIEHSLSKEEIIEAYLNTIYLGHGCYGVNAAARTYFNKSVKKLNLIECASLAALPQSPDTYALLKLASEAQDVVDSEVVATEPDTVVTNDISRGRRQLTLDLMLAQNYITKEDYDKVYDLTLNEFIDPNLSSTNSIYSYFHEYLVDTIVKDLMEEYNMEYADAERMVYTKGLQIYSTVDSTAMEVIAKEFQDGDNFPYVSASVDADGNMLNNDGQIALYRYGNYFNEKGNFKLSGSAGDVKVNKDGSITIMKNHKLYIYETEVDGVTDYSIEFKEYYYYDENSIMYSISGGYLNIPAAYKSVDSEGNVIIDKAYFEDPYYEGAIKIKGDDVTITNRAYTLSPSQRQPQAAMTIVGVGTGEVKAMVGGRQFGGQKVLNRSLNARQPGSSIKPLAVYGAALQKSYDLAEKGEKWQFTDFHIDNQGTRGWGDYVTTHSSIEDEKTKIEGKYWPNNFNNSFSGKNTFKTAIQNSINTCAVKLLLQVGEDYSIEQLKKFGLTTVQDDLSNPVNDANPAALALGAMTQGVEPLEMALAYAAFPGGGKVNTPICYTKVLDRNGEVLLEGKSEQNQALNEGVAWIMQEVLKSVVDYNNYMYVTDVEPGGKTGTTNDQYDIWFDGFTPTYAASIWIGTDENVEMSSMSTPAAALWGKIINQLPKAKGGQYSEMPSNVIKKGNDYFTKGTETGLTSWSNKEAKAKAKKEAYKKWLKEREKHKKLVPEKGHWEDVYGKVKVKDAWDETITETVTVVDKEAWDEEITTEITDPETGEVIGEETTTIHHDAETHEETKTKVVHHDAVYEKQKTGQKWVVDEKEHYVYEKGWRDGDFKYSG